MKSESEVGIAIPLSKVQKRVAEATRISRRTLCRVLKEGKNVEICVTMSFSTPRKTQTKSLH
jgi:DNA-binding transcriptional regulator LsrR (DeoR family)